MGKYTASVGDHLSLPARVLLTWEQQQLLRLAGRPVPSFVRAHLVIDTGSNRNTLVPGVIRHLQPAVGRSIRVETSLAAGETDLFWVRLEFPGSSLAPIPVIAVARLDLPPSLRAFHGVIGRDLLGRRESFLYEGRRGRFTLRDTPPGLFGWFRR